MFKRDQTDFAKSERTCCFEPKLEQTREYI